MRRNSSFTFERIHERACDRSRVGYRSSLGKALRLSEEIRIDPLDLISGASTHADIELDHKLCKPFAVDKNDARVNGSGVLSRILRKGRRGQEYTLPRSLALQSTSEPLNIRTPYESELLDLVKGASPAF